MTNQSQKLKEWKHRLRVGHEIRRAERRKHFTYAESFKKGDGKVIGEIKK